MKPYVRFSVAIFPCWGGIFRSEQREFVNFRFDSTSECLSIFEAHRFDDELGGRKFERRVGLARNL